jgi:hypothetical protein
MTGAVDLHRAPLAEIRALDLRARDRDLWTDEAALWDRFEASWAGLDDAAWRLPGAAPSDAGGPDWSLLDHVAHVAGWEGLAVRYVATAIETGIWPDDEEFAGGDFDIYNETLRADWAEIGPAEVRERLASDRTRLLALGRTLGDDAVRGDDAWGWVYMTLHGHQLDHLSLLEPWAERLRQRQAEGDPFGPDPSVGTGDPGADRAAFWAAEASAAATLDELLDAVPKPSWEIPGVTPGWTLADHVGHLGSWYHEAVRALEAYRSDGTWLAAPSEGLDAWNAREVERLRSTPATELRAWAAAGRRRLHELADGLDEAAFRSTDGWAWTYENLTGHVRSHLAMIAPWCVRTTWPGGPDQTR